MHATIEAFLHYGYLIAFGWVLLEQLGLPLPSTPILLTAGTLTATHKMQIGWVIVAAMAGCAISDSVWFHLGGRYGSTVTHWICKFSLETASCIRKTENMLAEHGAAGLLVAKFVPGLNTLAPPLAGQSKMRYGTFLAYDMAGSLFWVASIVLAGRFFGDAIRRNEMLLGWMSRSALALMVLVVAVWIGYKLVRQRSFLRKIRTLRIEPEELKAMMDRGENPYIVDLRHPLDLLPDAKTLPGAIRLLPDELIARNGEIPRDRDVVLYCTCPSEATSAKVALAMRRLGVDRIRPLRGGFDGWKQHGYPLEEVANPIRPPAAAEAFARSSRV